MSTSNHIVGWDAYVAAAAPTTNVAPAAATAPSSFSSVVPATITPAADGAATVAAADGEAAADLQLLPASSNTSPTDGSAPAPVSRNSEYVCVDQTGATIMTPDPPPQPLVWVTTSGPIVWTGTVDAAAVVANHAMTVVAGAAAIVGRDRHY